MKEIGKEILQRIKRWFRSKTRKLYKILVLCYRRFIRWNYHKIVIGICCLFMIFGCLGGYQLGRMRTEKLARKQEKELVTQHIQETESLTHDYQKKLEKAEQKQQDTKPKERPWNLVLVNDTHPMKEGYVPKLADIGDGQSVDARIAKQLKNMLADAEKEGFRMVVCSSYRSVEKQKELYNRYIGNEVARGKDYWSALEETIRSTAFPGKSEHNLGLAVDIVSANYMELDQKQESTPEAKWLAKNCYKYGFILRYPVDKTEITGIIYEPWHYRYVGVEDATKIMQKGLTLEEYLGEN